MFHRPFQMMFYEVRLSASFGSKEVSSEDEPKNGQGVVRGMCILPSRLKLTGTISPLLLRRNEVWARTSTHRLAAVAFAYHFETPNITLFLLSL